MSAHIGAGARSRASVDAHGPRAWSAAQHSLNGVSGVRPASEVVAPHGLQPNQSAQSQGLHNAETEALDRWFEDLSHYEQTLEEMAAASLDANFKEELTAIEQWFKVLSEAERTAALYSLLQSSTPLQMRFFITVLQQMARSDDLGGALMSPANPSQLSLETQLEAKLASMKLAGSGSRQSIGHGPAVSSNHTLSDDSGRPSIDIQSAQPKFKAASRTSAPAHLNPGPMHTVPNQPSSLWSDKEAVMERRTPSPDPTATALSPLVGGNWASMVNTPLVPLFAGSGVDEAGSTMEPGLRSPNLEQSMRSPGASNWNRSATGDNIVLDDVRKFRRSARVDSGPATRSLASPSLGLGLAPSPSMGSSRIASNGALNSPGLQQAAMAAQQNWRNGLNSPGLAQDASDQFGAHIGQGGQSVAHGYGLSQGQIAGQSAQQAHGLHPSTAANNQLANLFALQQQLFQQQQQLNNFAAAGLNLSPAAAQLGFQHSPAQRGQPGFGLANFSGLSPSQARRSPRPDRGGNLAYGLKSPTLPVAGSGANPDEPVDQALLSDVSAWLRSLRLHKYTANFQDWDWKDMIMLDDAGLQEKGVSALGARRKLLKVFETVRIKTGRAQPGDGASPNLSVNGHAGDDGGSNPSLSPVSPGFPDEVQDQ